jgi:hypothetical protein
VAQADRRSCLFPWQTVTLLHQDSVGGLEVQDPHTGIYHPATPIPGTIVVNVGDLLSRWSNNVLRSTLHRVVAPPLREQAKTDGSGETELATPARQSLAFFSNPVRLAHGVCRVHESRRRY